MTRTRNLLIWSQTRYHCATGSLHIMSTYEDVDLTIEDSFLFYFSFQEVFVFHSRIKTKIVKKIISLELRGIEPRTSHMRSEHSNSELQPLIIDYVN